MQPGRLVRKPYAGVDFISPVRIYEFGYMDMLAYLIQTNFVRVAKVYELDSNPVGGRVKGLQSTPVPHLLH
jgi:hypothetical protein